MQSPTFLPRATRPALTVLGLLFILFPLTLGGACLLPAPTALVIPGPVEPVDSLIRIDGRSYEPQGHLYLTSIRVSLHPRLGHYLLAQLQPDIEPLPRDVALPPYLTHEEFAALSQRLLVESQSIAQIVALRQAGYDARTGDARIKIVGTIPGTPAADLLQSGDTIEAANGEPLKALAELVSIAHTCLTGEPLELRIRRSHRLQTVTIPALRGPLDTEGPVLGVMAITTDFDCHLPLDIAIDPGPMAGGPSGGLMYALGVYNALSTEDITRGHRIAGAGTLRLSGAVGPVGAVHLKVRAAEDAGVEYFIAAEEDAPAARVAAREVKIISVASFDQALAALRELDAAPSSPRVVPAGRDTTLAQLTRQEPPGAKAAGLGNIKPSELVRPPAKTSPRVRLSELADRAPMPGERPASRTSWTETGGVGAASATVRIGF